MNSEALDQLVSGHPGCRVAAFADLEVGIPLRMSDGAGLGQEALNRLCAEARTLFDAWGHPAQTAVDARGADVKVCVQGDGADAIALIAVLDRSADLDAFLDAARACIGEGDA